jgi:hypothetical protein
MRIGSRRAGILALGIAWGLSSGAAAIAQVPVQKRVPALGVLVRGPDALRGLPFFSANAIPALRVEYILVPAGSVPIDAAGAVSPGRVDPIIRVWCSREPLVLGPAWKPIALGARRALLLAGTDPEPSGAEVSRSVPSNLAVPAVLALPSARYTLVFELPEDNQVFRSFAVALDGRFALFFENAPSDAELSFPAFVAFP